MKMAFTWGSNFYTACAIPQKNELFIYISLRSQQQIDESEIAL